MSKDKTTNNNTFHALINAMNEHANKDTIDTPEGIATLNALSTAVCYSVLKKCIDPQRKKALEQGKPSNSGCNQTLVNLWREISVANRYAKQLLYCTRNAEKFEFNANGETVSIVIDKDVADKLNKLIDERMNDSNDLLQECMLSILLEINKQKCNKQSVDLERPYNIKVLSKRIYLNLEDTPEYRCKETTPIQEVFKAVRRVLVNNRSLCIDSSCKYSYIQEFATDDNGFLDTVYYRCGKYADIGGYAKDFNGAETLYTVENEQVYTMEKMVKSLNLTARQAQILKLRLEGLSVHAIADRMNITQQGVQKHMKLIQDKFKKMSNS